MEVEDVQVEHDSNPSDGALYETMDFDEMNRLHPDTSEGSSDGSVDAVCDDYPEDSDKVVDENISMQENESLNETEETSEPKNMLSHTEKVASNDIQCKLFMKSLTGLINILGPAWWWYL